MSNPHMNFWADLNEQKLLHDLTTEVFKNYGLDVVYVPREARRSDSLYSEDILSQFTATFPVEIYLKQNTGWGGMGNMMSKFTMVTNHTTTVLMSVQTFTSKIGSVRETSRPYEGDLIYFPAPIDKLFEVKFVEMEKADGQFYPLGVVTFYELSLELATYSHEKIATDIEEVNSFQSLFAYTQTVTLQEGGSGTYTVGEVVTQGPTTSAIVSTWDEDTRTLTVTSVTGTLADGIALVGQSSEASYLVSAVPDTQELPTDRTADNATLSGLTDELFTPTGRPNIGGGW